MYSIKIWLRYLHTMLIVTALVATAGIHAFLAKLRDGLAISATGNQTGRDRIYFNRNSSHEID
jgi:hypothetical protein